MSETNIETSTFVTGIALLIAVLVVWSQLWWRFRGSALMGQSAQAEDAARKVGVENNDPVARSNTQRGGWARLWSWCQDDALDPAREERVIMLGLTWIYSATIIAVVALALAGAGALYRGDHYAPQAAVGLAVASLAMTGISVTESCISVSLKSIKRKKATEAITERSFLYRWKPECLFAMLAMAVVGIVGWSVASVYHNYGVLVAESVTIAVGIGVLFIRRARGGL